VNELKTEWKKWDESEDESTRRKALDKMLDVLNRRNYIRNLLRDVNEAME
jgi:molecular chaperone HscB